MHIRGKMSLCGEQREVEGRGGKQKVGKRWEGNGRERKGKKNQNKKAIKESGGGQEKRGKGKQGADKLDI